MESASQLPTGLAFGRPVLLGRWRLLAERGVLSVAYKVLANRSKVFPITRFFRLSVRFSAEYSRQNLMHEVFFGGRSFPG